MNVEGRVADGGVGEGVKGGNAILLSTRLMIDGAADCNLAFICHTEVNLASRLQVSKASS